jgi:hypothetical protein
MSGLVSIIMPVYNGEAFIAQAIDSVLAQTYSNWELIVVNDGSTDGTADILTGYTDPRIRCIHQANQGLAGARNTGIYAAHGTYLAFLDADDEWSPLFRERCVAALESESNLAGIYTSNYHIDQDGMRLPQTGAQAVSPEALYERLLEGGFFPPCTVVVRTQIVMEVGLFDTGLQGQGTEDWDLWLRITKRYPMRGIPEPLAGYRVYPGSMSTNAAKMHACRISALTKQFGPPEGDSTRWRKEKRRAYGFAYSGTAFAYTMQGDTTQGWQLLDRAVQIYPNLLERVETYYELACGDQDRTVRGMAVFLDLADAKKRIFGWLTHLNTLEQLAVASFRGKAYGSAYLALTMLSNQSGSHATREYLRNALRANPRLITHKYVIFQLTKQSIGWTPMWKWMRLVVSKKKRMGK